MTRQQQRRPGFLESTAIVGVGYSPITRESGRSVLSLAAEAAREAIDDAGLNPQEIDGIATFSYMADSVPGQALATVLGLPSVGYILDSALGGQAPCYAVMNAAMAVHAGLADHVLVYRALNGRSGPRVGSRPVVGGASSYRLPIGFGAYPQYIAMWARRYMIETGAGVEDLAAVPIAQRAYSARNERAMVRSPLTLDEYMDAPVVADPFRVPDCAIEVDGACALIVTSVSAARSLRQTPAIILSAAYESGPRAGLEMGDALLWDDYTRNYTSFLADRLWGWAGMNPSDVDCAQLYDCFSSTVLMGLEGLGLVGRGEAGPFVRAGETGPGGHLPVNTNGGLLAEGYLHGMNSVAEAVLQLQGRCGSRNVDDAETCVVTSGGMMDGSALVLAKGS